MSETELITLNEEQCRKYWAIVANNDADGVYSGMRALIHAFQRDYPRQAPQPQPAPKTSGMTFSEALEAMKRGERVRLDYWDEGGWIEIKEGRVISNYGIQYIFLNAVILDELWEIYQEPKPKTAREIAEEEFGPKWENSNHS